MKMAEGLLGGGGLLGGLLGGGMLGGGAMPGGPAVGGATPEILRANPGAREAAVLSQFLNAMYQGGARHFLVSGVPAFLEMPIFNILWPIIGNMVEQGKLEDLGVSPGDPPQLAMQVQAAALCERWSELVEAFSRGHPDATCVFFDEVSALEKLRASLGEAAFDRSMWDMSMFHPTAYGHQQLASEAHRCVAEAWPALGALAPHPEAQPRPGAEAERKAKEEAERKAKEEAERKAKEEAELKAKAEAELKAKEDAERKAALQKEPKPLSVSIRNVKGDVTFAVACDARWRAPELREAVLAAAPSGFADAGSTCVLAVKGKFLGNGPETLEELGVTDGMQVIAVVKAAAAGAKSPTNAG